jgi:hypothetical protein
LNPSINNSELEALHKSVANHGMYNKINNLNDLKIMMESHVFAVWDFMSLLKRLQQDITCVAIPWKPSIYPKNLVRLINEIVLGEESDLDQNGNAIDHFTLYLKAMDEIGADYSSLKQFMNDENYYNISEGQRNFVQFNLDLARNGKIHEVAAAFFFGREKLIPDMFTSIINDLENNINKLDQNSYRSLKYYLLRHIEIDGGEHSHLAQDCLNALCGNDPVKREEANAAGIKSLKLRAELWAEVESRLINNLNM